MYDINKFREKLDKGFEIFQQLKIPEKEELLNRILDGLHANPTTGDLKKLKISTPFGMLQTPNGIKLSPTAQIIYQSPTGLIERKVSLQSL